MLAEERQARILDAVRQNGSVTTTALMEAFGASESTIRRDLAALDSKGLIARVHGGATAARGDYVMHDQAVSDRSLLNAESKTAIAAKAADLIGPDDFVYLDGGTTTLMVADRLSQSEATFVTDSLPIAQRLLAHGCHVILLGGTLKPLTEVVVGAGTLEALQSLHFSLGFFGTNGATPETGFTTPEPEEARVKRVALQHTGRPYVLCDSSKFGRISPITFAPFDGATIITDAMPEDASLRQFDNFIEVED